MPVIAYLTQLEHSQWLDARDLAAMQTRQLASRLADARAHCSIFREALAAAPVATDANARELLERLPLLTRSQLQDVAHRVYSSAPPPAHGTITVKTTSGSTAQPVNVRVTAASLALRHALLVRGMLWHALDFRRSIAMVRTTTAKSDNLTEEQDGWVFLFRCSPPRAVRTRPTLRCRSNANSPGSTNRLSDDVSVECRGAARAFPAGSGQCLEDPDRRRDAARKRDRRCQTDLGRGSSRHVQFGGIRSHRHSMQNQRALSRNGRVPHRRDFARGWIAMRTGRDRDAS